MARLLPGSFLLLAATTALSAQGIPEGAGTLVVIGGGLSPDNEAVYGAILEARLGDGPICIVPTASAEPEAAAERAVATFERWGGPGVARSIPLSAEDPGRAADPRVLTAFQVCAGFFFTGGVQSRILQVFRPEGEESPAARVLFARWLDGAVVAGSSAGAAMMSNPMIAGGSPGGRFDGAGGGVRREPGMGFLPDLLVDQHFLARGRMGRLVEAMLDPGAPPLAAGVDEDTALLVRGDTLAVVGRSGVLILDRRGESDPSPGPSLRVELLGPGDRLAVVPGAPVLPSSERAPLPPLGSDRFEGPEGGLFGRWILFRFLEAKARAELRWGGGSSTIRVDDGSRFHLTVLPGFRALGEPGGAGEGVAGTHAGLSTGPFLLQVFPPAPASPDGGFP